MNQRSLSLMLTLFLLAIGNMWIWHFDQTHTIQSPHTVILNPGDATYLVTFQEVKDGVSLLKLRDGTAVLLKDGETASIQTDTYEGSITQDHHSFTVNLQRTWGALTSFYTIVGFVNLFLIFALQDGINKALMFISRRLILLQI